MQYLLFQEAQQATQGYGIPEVGFTHPLNLHLHPRSTVFGVVLG